jgi:serine/threonine-protein kinase
VELLQGQPAQARARLAQAIGRASAELQPAHPRRLAAQLWLAVAEARMGACTAADAQVQAANAIIIANHLAAHPVLAKAQAALGKPIGACGVFLH